MLTLVRKKDFANGSVFCLQTDEGLLLEVTDTFLPYETKFCTNGTNKLLSENLGDRTERWMIGVSTMSGCPIRCQFCATGQMEKAARLHYSDIVAQILYVLTCQGPVDLPKFMNARELKINYTRMGEPFLNVEHVKEAIRCVEADIFNIYRNPLMPPVHHLISTIGLRGSDFSWITGNISLQLSLHSLNEERRRELIPNPNLMTIEELGQIRVKSDQKITLNMTLVDEQDFDIELLKRYFDPEFFFIKLSPINPNPVSEANHMGLGVLGEEHNLI